MDQSDQTRPTWVWGVPLAPLTLAGAVARIDELIDAGLPSFFITANLHYAMLTAKRADLRAVNARAAFILADGVPLVWGSRLQKKPLPERVAGADLVWKMCEQAACRGRRIFICGAAPGVAATAADVLVKRYPGLIVAGTTSPPFRELVEEEERELLEEIRNARPHLLLVAFGQPKGELWIARNYEKLQIPVCVQLGASIDFIAGKFRRAPRWIQRIGMEWLFRLSQEPRRLIGRYARDIAFLIRMLFTQTRPQREQ
jgi:N-acetylglucosaminyldiphosphoundecaprenol N-acetyl-beta-D-mannosaminyltransferase